jgi:hypothetical protein
MRGRRKTKEIPLAGPKEATHLQLAAQIVYPTCQETSLDDDDGRLFLAQQLLQAQLVMCRRWQSDIRPSFPECAR